MSDSLDSSLEDLEEVGPRAASPGEVGVHEVVCAVEGGVGLGLGLRELGFRVSRQKWEGRTWAP